MKIFLEPEDSNFFNGFDQHKHEKIGGEVHDSSYREQERQSESKHKSTWWPSFKIKVKSLWGKAKPVISGITVVLTTVTTLMKTATKFFRQYHSMKEGMA